MFNVLAERIYLNNYDGRCHRHVTVRILIRLFPKVAFATASLPYFQFCQTMPSTLLTELLTFSLSRLPQSEVCMTTARCRL